MRQVNLSNNRVTCDPEPCESTLSNNNIGGAILNQNELIIDDSTLDSNQAIRGAAIFNSGGNEVRTYIYNSTISNNQGSYGTIINYSFMLITNSTLSGNRSDVVSAPCAGIRNYQQLIVRSSTFANLGNSSAICTFPSSNLATPSSVTLKDSILLAEPGKNSCEISPSTSWTSKGYNIASDDSCQLTATGDLASTNPMLYPLNYYGGPTKTHALMQDSPARDHRPGSCVNSDFSPISIILEDQRHMWRDSRCDTGSYEIFHTKLFLPFIKK